MKPYKVLLEDSEGPADFETAISATGLGKFNLALLLVAIPSAWATVFDTKLMAYVSPVAQCDLELSLENKGMLNAITYMGILSSGFIWGVLADTYGRKHLLVICYFLDLVFTVLSSIAQNYHMLLITKFLAGFVMNGPTAILISLLSEFHSKKNRARFFLVHGMFSNLANVILPIAAWLIFQQKLHVLMKGLELHSWNFYILLSGLPSFISVFTHLALPESPKFLMSVGKNEEALQVFRLVYSWNTGNPKESYPIKQLVDETSKEEHETNNNCCEEVKEANESKNENDANDKPSSGWSKLKEKLLHVFSLFCPPYLWIMLILTVIQMGYKMGLNSFKNWIPQLFSAMNDYKTKHGGNAHFCDVLDTMTHEHRNSSVGCIVNLDNADVYTNLMIVQSSSVLVFILTGSVINRLGNRRLFVILGAVSGACGACIYFAQNTMTVVALSTSLTALSAVNTVVLNVSVVELLPTSLRTMAISLTRLTGLVETIIGNLVFPLLLNAGCAPPFWFVGIVTIGCSGVALLLPKNSVMH